MSFVFLDEAAEQHGVGAQFGRGIGRADDLGEESNRLVGLALFAQGSGDAVIGLEDFGGPGVKGLQFFKERTGAGDVTLFLRNAAESEE